MTDITVDEETVKREAEKLRQFENLMKGWKYVQDMEHYEHHSKAIAFVQGLYSKKLPKHLIKNILIFSAPKPLVEVVMIEMEIHIEITDLRNDDYTFDRYDRSYKKLIENEIPTSRKEVSERKQDPCIIM